MARQNRNLDPHRQAEDQHFMDIALAMGQRGLGTTAPNPSVGAVVVSHNNSAKHAEILGRGWTQPGGCPHAEPMALDQAGERAQGATLYVTLEPCSHHGKTPPCADAIIAHGISRVVVAHEDPDPRVAGRGFAKLRAVGIDVCENVRRRAAAQQLRGHILRITKNRPFVQLKLAFGADEKIAPGKGSSIRGSSNRGSSNQGTLNQGSANQGSSGDGSSGRGAVGTDNNAAPVWVTGAEARKHGHMLRATTDAMLVGRGTVAADNPRLDCRLPGLADASPVRVVLDSQLQAVKIQGLKLGDGSGPAVFWVGCDKLAASTQSRLANNASVIHIAKPEERRHLPPQRVVQALADKGITRLLIEGGPHISGSFLSAGLVDEVVVFRAPQNVGETGLPALAGDGFNGPAEGRVSRWLEKMNYKQTQTRRVGGDMMERYEREEKAGNKKVGEI